MSRLRKGLVLALEEMENEMLEPTEEEVVAEDDSAETKLAADEVVDEVSQASDEMDDMEDSIEETEADVDTLDSIHDTMEESVERGEGLSEDAAEIAEVAIEAIAARLGIKREGRLLPATESFKSTNSRVMATKIAMEETKSLAAQAKDAIIKAFNWIMEKLKEFAKYIMQNISKLKDRISSVLKKAQSSPSDATPKLENLSNRKVATVLAIDGKAGIDEAKLLAEAIRFNMGIQAQFRNAVKILTTAPVDQYQDLIQKTLKDYQSKVEGKHLALPGSKTIVVDPENISIKTERAEVKPVEEIKALTKEQIIQSLKIAEGLAKDLEKFSAAQESFDLNKLKTLITKALEADDVDPQVVKQYQALKDFLTKAMLWSYQATLHDAFMLINNITEYGEIALANLEAKSE